MKNNYLLKFKLSQLKNYAVPLLLLLITTSLQAQTSFAPGGPWTAGWVSSGSAGQVVYPNGVVQLLSNSGTTCEGASVQRTNEITTGTSWTKCYKTFFGCPGTDNIGSDNQGDGMAWSIYDPNYPGCDAGTLKLGSCGGGLGYNATPCARMLTIEFDTYSSAGTGGYDANYGGTVTPSTGNQDELSLHMDGKANDGAWVLTSTNPGNLEDGLEHDVCISYTTSGTYGSYNGTITVKIDGVTKLTYALGNTYSLETYFDPSPPSGQSSGPGYTNNNVFDAANLAVMWSSGKQNASNPATVSPDNTVGITANLPPGTTLCPASVSLSASSLGCGGSYQLAATVNPPTGNTVTKVEFYEGATLLGTVTSAPYNLTINPSSGSHTYTAKAYYSGGGTTTSSGSTVNVGSSSTSMGVTSTAPTIGGSVDAIWSSYTATAMNHRQTGSPVNDANLGATYTIMYDNTNLYVLVNVTDDVSDVNDPTIWQNDAVELFIDVGKDAGTTSYGASDQHYLFSRSGSSFQEGNGHATTGVSYGVIEKAVGQGYYMEIKMPWSTLNGSAYTPPPGGSLGFDVSVDDADGAQRTNIVDWNDGTFQDFANPSLMGTLTFSGCDPLPVELLSFTATKKNGTVVLNWATASEKNNNKFIIERSSDGINWVAVGEVIGIGNTSSITNYTFTDLDPLDGISYYHLRQIDVNGSSSISWPVVVLTSNQQVSVSPNPFDDVLKIVTNIKGEINVSIYDVVGRLLYETNQEVKDGELTIHPELAGGAYIVKINSGEFLEYYRVIKK